MHKCAGCGSGRIHPTGQTTRDITEIHPRPPPTTTRHTTYVYECDKCGAKDMEPETGLPSAGALGSGACAEIANNFMDRMPHRMNADRMAHVGLSVATGTVHNTINRLGHNLSAPAATILAVLLNAHMLHIDETSFKVNGDIVWVWIFLDPVTKSALYVLRPSSILDDHRGNPTAPRFLTKLEGAADDLFEFVLDPRIDYTNNAAERGLRELVTRRKIRGTLRSLESLITLSNLFTCAVTWKNQGLDRVAELRKYA